MPADCTRKFVNRWTSPFTIVWRHGAQVRLLGLHYQEWDAASDVHCILLKGAGPKVGVPVNFLLQRKCRAIPDSCSVVQWS